VDGPARAGYVTGLETGFALEYATLGWNLIGIVVLAITAITARPVAGVIRTH
jgi:hypothetical protein